MRQNSVLAVLVATAWCGLLTGLLEGAAYARFPLLRNPDLPWIVVLFDLSVFLISGCGFVLLARFLPGHVLAGITHFFFFLVMFYDCATVGVGDHAERLILRVVAIVLAAVLGLLVWKFTFGWAAMQRRSLVCVALFALLYTGIPPVRRALRERQELAQVSVDNGSPNVLVVIVDALRADHLSTYGYSRVTSPALTQFASRGVLFKNAIAASSWTLPSHASILTGHLPHEHGADRPDSYLDTRLPTLAEAFRARGYRTAAFSANWWFFARRLGFGRGFMHFQDFDSAISAAAQTNMGQRLQNVLLKLRILRAAVGRSRADYINRDILTWIDRSHGPFFVVANYMDVHEPYLPPLDCFHRFSRLARPPGLVVLGNPGLDSMTPAEVKNEMEAYDASIYCLDRQVASLQRELQRRGLLENTIVVFTSDHGDGFHEHGLMSHGNSLYTELIHVPLIMAGPGIPAGVTVDRPVSLRWLPATLLTLKGEQPGPFPGVPLEQAWRSGAQSLWPNPVSELRAMYVDPKAPNFSSDLKSLVTPKWHLIASAKGVAELYDYGADPHELENRVSGNQAVAQILKDQLQQRETPLNGAAAAAEAQGEDSRPSQPRSGSAAKLKDEQARDRQKMNDYLKALGYAPQ
jgi:arylsulfatase A-like enzyme